MHFTVREPEPEVVGATAAPAGGDEPSSDES
jgi:hypothetical protein